MKRILSLLLTILLIPAMLAVPAFADEFSPSYWFNVLDYGFRLGDSNNYIDYATESTNNRVTVSYNVDPYLEISDVDILFRTDSTNFSLSQYSSGGGPFKIYSLGDGVYRAVGSVDRADATLYFYLNFTDGSYLHILEYRAASLSFNRYEKVCSGMIHDYSTSPATQSSISYKGDGNPSGVVTITPSSYESATFRSDMDIYGWQGMDYIQLSLSSFCTSIDSIQVLVDSVSVPYQVNFLDLDKRGEIGLAFIDLLIDVRGLDRSSDSNIIVQVSGSVDAPRVGNFVIQRCLGLVEHESLSLWTFWFTKLGSWFDSLSNSIGNYFSDLKTYFNRVFVENVEDIGVWISNQTSSIGAWFSESTSSIQTWGDNVNSSIIKWGQNVVKQVGDGTGAITGWIRDTRDSVATWGQALKDSIDALPDKIAEALEALMVPSDSAIQDFGESSQQIAQDRFGGVYEGAMIVDSFAGQLQAQAATQILTVPVVNLNILGTPFPLGGWEVDLVPEGSEVIIEAVKLMIDILATLAFINGIKFRLERTLEQ